MAVEGWVKNYRKIEKWEWYTTPNMAHIFQHLIRSASHCDTRWHGIEIKTGQLVTGRKALSAATGVSEKSIRTCLSRLEQTGEIIKKTASKFSIITICKYSEFQIIENEEGQQRASKGPAKGHIQELKNVRIKEKESGEKSTHGSFQNVLLSEEEIKKLKTKLNGTFENRIERLSAYLESSGKKYKSHYATILKWLMDEPQTKKEETEWQ